MTSNGTTFKRGMLGPPSRTISHSKPLVNNESEPTSNESIPKKVTHRNLSHDSIVQLHHEPNSPKYRILSTLGKGATAIVYRVMDESSRRLYALKVLYISGTGPSQSDALLLSNPLQELDIMKRMEKCIWVVSCIDHAVSTDSEEAMFLMQLGEIDLATMLKAEQRPLELHWIRYYFWQLVEGIHALHDSGVLHCDIKPANFVLNQGRLCCIDFGIARYIVDKTDIITVPQEGQVGTVNYMSPESLKGFTPFADIGNQQKYVMIGTFSDVWSLGVILYEMLYGKTPFGHIESLKQRIHGILNQDIVLPVDSGYDRSDPRYACLEKLVLVCLKRSTTDRISIDDLLNTIRML
jgi:serine/threonine-protein kinase TTK/MPS1